jgi:hypothetical protein
MTSALTKTATRAVNRQIRALQRERRDWLTGKLITDMGWWGIPWCRGPGCPGHQESLCEGCGTVAWCRDRAAEVAGQIRQLEASLVPEVQGALW